MDTVQMWSYCENLTASCEILDSAGQAVHHTEPQFKITELTLYHNVLQRRIRANNKKILFYVGC